MEEPEVKYDIYVNDWDPDLKNPGVRPFGASYRFDINGDSINDLLYEVNNWSKWYDSSGYDVFYIVNLEWIKSIDSTLSIAINRDTNSFLFEEDEMILNSTMWTDDISIFSRVYWRHPSHNNMIYYHAPFDKNYGIGHIAIRRIIGNDKYYGWIKLKVDSKETVFYESGFNRVPNVPIRIGQRE